MGVSDSLAGPSCGSVGARVQRRGPVCGVRGGICLRYRRGRQRAVHGERVRVQVAGEGGGGPGLRPRVETDLRSGLKNELNAQSERVRVHTHTNQLTYPHA